MGARADDSGEASKYYLSLDQAMIMGAIGNALGGDMLRSAFATPDFKRALRPVMGIEEFNDDPRGCTITGTAGSDRLVGTPGNDVICAGAGDDRVEGGGGGDAVFGDDVLSGGLGNDRLDGGAGADFQEGGAGTDVCQAAVTGGDAGDGCE